MSRVQNRSPQSSLDHKRRRSSESRNSFIDLSPPDSDEPSPSPSSSSSRRRKQETSPPVRHSMDNAYLHRAEKDNQRSSSERAELVERSRKLAKIFGETPGAADVARTDPSKLPAVFSGDKSRRHSTPLTPDTSSFDLAASKDLSSQSVKSRASEPSSPTSFMNLSEDEDSPTTPKKRRAPRSSSLTPSALESLGPEERAEEERKIKPPHSGSLSDEMTPTDESSRKAWIRRRRRSSIAAFPSDYTDRVKEDLDEKEKAINVRRAQKMEKVFGVAPPQTLFHTRHAPVTSIQIPASQAYLPSPTRNQNQSSYSKKSRRTDSRPGTSDSTEGLIPKNFGEGASRPRRGSVVYNHYQHSLNSLNDIIDRDDVQSLASLRQYLETDATDPPSSEARLADEISLVSSKRSSTLSSRSERRRSMPPVSPSARNSYMSFGYNDLSPDVDSFQARRRKATKLTQFFGVDYTEVIQDVLERGTLNAEEVEDLRRALRNLKSKRTKAL
ncbi:hypothetical protein DL96DRAFT_1575129 [Flagelloscypha sp. PMI_526]|nr:hypothetical protein DL96DRAFT_1575129 [Flagelloscypha sp. PMI_526]